ncbi:MAG: hypothetical protein QF464_18700, partial [Myxococcota bacterium]|nr:hypothetical protein [Myxococcota bacterium]
TAIAAQSDMPVYTWVLAEARAVPLNFFHVVLNEGAIDWLNCATDKDEETCDKSLSPECREAYLDTITSAANSAAGHGFVTEFAGNTQRMKDTLYWDGRFDTEALKQYGDCEGYCSNPKLCGPDVPPEFREGDSLCGPGAFLFAMNEQRYPVTPLLLELIRTFIPKPPEDALPDECKTDAGFYGLNNIDGCLAYMDPSWTFDAEGFADELYTRIVHPMQQAQALFDTHGYMTRLFTTVSPADMDRDPLFSFNPDLPDISNVHEVTATATCKADSNYQAETIVLTYPSGAQRTFEGDFDHCDGVAVLADPPNEVTAVAEIQVMREQGEPEPVPLEAVDEMDDVLDGLFPTHGQSTVVSDRDRNTDPIGNTGTLGVDRNAEEPANTSRPEEPSAQPSGGCQGGGRLGDLAMWLGLIGLIVVTFRRDPYREHLQ